MNKIAIETFIEYCDDMILDEFDIAEEGFFGDLKSKIVNLFKNNDIEPKKEEWITFEEALDENINSDKTDKWSYYNIQDVIKGDGTKIRLKKSVLMISPDTTKEELRKNKSRLLKEIYYALDHYREFAEIAFICLINDYKLKDSFEKMPSKVFDYGFSIFHNSVTHKLQCGGIFTYGKKVSYKTNKATVIPTDAFKKHYKEVVKEIEDFKAKNNI